MTVKPSTSELRQRTIASDKRKLSEEEDTSDEEESRSRAGSNEDNAVKGAEKKDWEKRNISKIITRVVFGVGMIAGFLCLIYAGHLYVCLMVMGLQVAIYRELLQVRYKAAKERGIPYFRTVQWLWFMLALFYTFGDNLYTFASTRRNVSVLMVFLKYHYWISFSLYSFVFVVTVLSFKKGYYKYQMGQLAWTLLTLLLTVFQCKYMYENIFEGMFWFLLPVSLVICNDCFAYFSGLLFGRKFIKYPFLKLSPNKTWEGFIGAFICTLIFSLIWTYMLSQYEWMICPLNDLFATKLSCTPHEIFIPFPYRLPPTLASLTGVTEVTLVPVQAHGLALATFASLVAPFGGFFASAIKRAYNVKDFDSIIPGHGGLTDRMDCQFIMSFCTAVHRNTFVRTRVVDVAMVLSLVSFLSKDEQEEVHQHLQQTLFGV